MPVFEGVEMLQYVENGPSPNYRPWYEQLALAVEQRVCIHGAATYLQLKKKKQTFKPGVPDKE